jgi:hypothetical protein
MQGLGRRDTSAGVQKGDVSQSRVLGGDMVYVDGFTNASQQCINEARRQTHIEPNCENKMPMSLAVALSGKLDGVNYCYKGGTGELTWSQIQTLPSESRHRVQSRGEALRREQNWEERAASME